MKVTVKRSGGFAGLIRPPVQVDTSLLPRNHAAAVEAAVRSLDFMSLPELLPAAKNQADRFQYQVTVDDAGASHTITAGEDDLGNVKQLIDAVYAAKAG